jgi:putative FmdB family regulatory protein
MPMYEYRCGGCGTVFETLRGLRDKDEEVECPHCGAKQAERMLSAFSSTGTRSADSSSGPCSVGGFT